MVRDNSFITTSEMTVELIDSMGGDRDIVQAARVSVAGENVGEDGEGLSGKDAGLVRWLMKSRHGCYSADTEVLTKRGWINWSEAKDNDLFMSKNLKTGVIDFQKASRIVDVAYTGDLIRFKNQHIDLLVTPNHKMVVTHRINGQGEYTNEYLKDADQMEGRAYRIPKAGGLWVGEETQWSYAELGLLGFFIGDGNSPGVAGTPSFNIRKAREIAYITAMVDQIEGASLNVMASGARSITGLSREYRELLSSCYDSNKRKVVPSVLLGATVGELTAIFDGMLNADGSIEGVKRTYFTTSEPLRDQFQEICLKIGLASDYSISDNTQGKYAGEDSKPVFVISVFAGRNSNPRLGWTKALREEQITRVEYDGRVYCATVPNGTLYVRRSGKTAWSGNSPFEHDTMKFYVSAPIFVFREFMRHRIGFSYNEMSGRYVELPPKFYVPDADRALVNDGTSGRPKYVAGTSDQYDLVKEAHSAAFSVAVAEYNSMLDAGVAKEVARTVLPVGLYSEMYVTCNARSLMSFLALRVRSEDSRYETHPQAEIQMVAEQMEEEFAKLFPVTYAAFIENGRVAP